MGSHKIWRKNAKKAMRKRKRIRLAIERNEAKEHEEENRLLSPTYRSLIAEQDELDKRHEEEQKILNEKMNEVWLHEEELAQQRWLKQQRKLEKIKTERAKQELFIREEWEKEQQKLNEKATIEKEKLEREQRRQMELAEKIEDYIAGDCAKLPSEAKAFVESIPGGVQCPFFAKVAACKYGNACSRNHKRPTISQTLLIPGFFTNFHIEHVGQSNEYDTDVGLEIDEGEIYEHFIEFYHDVLNEMKQFGTVIQFKVCRNEEPHLRGNVYVQYKEEKYAIKAFRALQGRFYGGKQITVEFCYIESWSKAICGSFLRKNCPKNNKCNFLHVFHNPDRCFSYKNDDTSSSKRALPCRERINGWSSSDENDDVYKWQSKSPKSKRKGNKHDSNSHSHRHAYKEISHKRRRARSRSHSYESDRSHKTERNKNKKKRN